MNLRKEISKKIMPALGVTPGKTIPGSVIITWKVNSPGSFFEFTIYTSEHTRILANWGDGTIEQLEESSPNYYSVSREPTHEMTTVILTFEDPSAVVYFQPYGENGKFLRFEGLELLSNCIEFDLYEFKQLNFALPPNAEYLALYYGVSSSPYLWNLPSTTVQLHMWHCQIDQFQPDFLPQSLEELDLSYNYLQSFDSAILPTSLQILAIPYNNLSTFDFEHLPSLLDGLILSHNNLSDFNPLVALPNALRMLRLNANPLGEFNPTIELPNSLVYLDVANTGLTIFNPTERLPYSITELRINDNNLETPAIDNALYLLDGQTFNEDSKTLRGYQLTNATYSGAAAAAINSLVSKNWNILLPPGETLYYIQLMLTDGSTVVFDGFFTVNDTTHIVNEFYDAANPTVNIRSTGGSGEPTYLYYPGWLCFDGGGCNITSFPYAFGSTSGDYNMYGSTASSTGQVGGAGYFIFAFSLTPFS